jgi:hypothetical protein
MKLLTKEPLPTAYWTTPRPFWTLDAQVGGETELEKDKAM